MFIAANEPDLILISEILPKAHNAFISKPQLALPGFSVFFNFDPDDQSSYSSGIRGVAIYVAGKFAVSEVNFSDCNFCLTVSVSRWDFVVMIHSLLGVCIVARHLLYYLVLNIFVRYFGRHLLILTSCSVVTLIILLLIGPMAQ